MSAAGSFPNGMPGEPVYGSSAPRAISGKAQPRSGGRTKKVKVKAHTRTVKPKAPVATAPATPAVPSDQALINAAVRSRFAPQEQALGAQLTQNARFNSGTNDWYAQALNEIKGLRDQGNAAAQQTLGRITAYNSQPTLANANDQQAAAARNNLNSEYAAAFGRDATGNSDAMNRLAAAYAIQQGNTQNATNAQRIGLLGQQGQLGQQKADYGLTYGAQLGAAEQKAAADQTKLDIAAKALGVKTKTLNQVQIPLAKSLSQDRVAGQKVARSGVRVKQQNSAETKHQHEIENALAVNKQAEKAYIDAHPELKGTGGKNKATGRYTKTQLNNYDNQWRGALATAQHLQNAKTWTPKSGPNKGKPQPITRETVYSALLKEYPKDPEFASAAADVIFGRQISGGDLHILSTKGVHPKGLTAFANWAKGLLK